MTYSRAAHLAIADATEGYERVRVGNGLMIRLDWHTGVAAPYPRQQHRNRIREEARAPSFTDRLAFALSQLEWFDIAEGGHDYVNRFYTTSAMGLMSTSPMSPVINRRVKRYRAAYLSERQEPIASYEDRYKALFSVL